MSTKKTDLEEALNRVLDEYQNRTAQLHDVLAPKWNARADTLKTIVSLSSASIVLSVTFSSSLRQLNAGSAWRYLIIFSFALFVIALVIAFLALWLGSGLYQMQSRVLDQRRAMTNVLMKAKSAEEVENALEGILKNALQPLFEQIVRFFVESCGSPSSLSLRSFGLLH